MRDLPLQGIRVVEAGQIVAGPTAGLILADMGADVIKVEPLDAGTQRRPGNKGYLTGPMEASARRRGLAIYDLFTRKDKRLLPRIADAIARRDSQDVVDVLVRADVTIAAPVHTPRGVSRLMAREDVNGAHRPKETP